jgi:hypothetical protein
MGYVPLPPEGKNPRAKTPCYAPQAMVNCLDLLEINLSIPLCCDQCCTNTLDISQIHCVSLLIQIEDHRTRFSLIISHQPSLFQYFEFFRLQGCRPQQGGCTFATFIRSKPLNLPKLLH